jgi:mono/diheme cytochrome c family protein
MKRQRLSCAGFVLAAAIACAAQAPWAHHLSHKDWARTNPYAGQAEAIAAGSRLFEDHCAQCHGKEALGRRKRPSLRSKEVQTAADAELFWMLRNGNLRHGMPSWSSLPEAQRWQLITYIKGLGQWSIKETAETRPEKAQ